MFGLYDMFSGGNLSQVTIFALGIMPYISASIILQLLTVVWPYLEKLSKEGELGPPQDHAVHALRHDRAERRAGARHRDLPRAPDQRSPAACRSSINPGSAFRLMTVLTLTTGTCFIMWLGEQITERGIGNGMSLIIYAGIVVGLPRAVMQTFDQMRTGQLGLIRILFLLVMMALVIAGDHLRRARAPAGDRPVRQARRRPPDVRRLEHAHSAEGEHRRRHPGDLRLVDSGVPGDDRAGVPGRRGPTRSTTQLGFGMPLYNLLYVAGIIFFAYFYTAIIFNPDDVAENMRKYGGFVPGIRPGKRTAEYIDTILTRITLAGAVYLALIAILPEFLLSGFKVAPIPFIGEWLDAALPRFITRAWACTFYFGGTSLLIVVGVAMDTVQQVESQLIMRHYDGFMKKTRIRGRRGVAMALNLIMLGPAGRGKGHAGGAVRAQPRDPEDFDRRHPARGGDRRGTEIGLRAKAIMDRGELVSDDVMIGIVQRAARRPDVRERVHPRRVSADGGAGRGARRR